MLDRIRSNRRVQLALGLIFGACFGFLLQKGGVTRYSVILGQLLLEDWTVLKVMLTAVIVGSVGVHILIAMGLATGHRKSASFGKVVVGGLIFGLGFGLLGYCPGTGMGAVGQGSLDAIAGVLGMILGAASFAAVYPKVKDGLLRKGSFGEMTLADLLHVPVWLAVTCTVAVVLAALLLIEKLGG